MRHRPLLACVLLLGACFSSQQKSTSSPQPSSPQERAPDYSATIADPLGFLPRDSEIVLSLDAAQVRESALWTAFEPRLLAAAGPELSTFQTVCGFDPLQKLRGITVGIKGKEPDVEGVIVVSGFDRAQVMDCLARATKETGGAQIDGELVTIPVSDKGSATVFTFVDASTVVLAYGKTVSKESLQAILASGSPLRTSEAFSKLFATIDTDASVWMVVNGRYIDDGSAALGANLQAVFGSLTLRDGVAASVRLRLGDAGQATNLASIVQGQIGAAKSFFEKLEVKAEDVDLVVDASMTAQQLATMVSMLGGMAGAP